MLQIKSSNYVKNEIFTIFITRRYYTTIIVSQTHSVLIRHVSLIVSPISFQKYVFKLCPIF